MSRVDYNYPELGLTFSFGVDHVTSTFVNVEWDRGIDDPLSVSSLMVDNQGWTAVIDEDNFTTNKSSANDVESFRLVCDPKLFDHLLQLSEKFLLSRKAGNPFPNLHAEDVIGVATAIGLPIDDTFKADVYKALD